MIVNRPVMKAVTISCSLFDFLVVCVAWYSRAVVIIPTTWYAVFYIQSSIGRYLGVWKSKWLYVDSWCSPFIYSFFSELAFSCWQMSRLDVKESMVAIRRCEDQCCLYETWSVALCVPAQPRVDNSSAGLYGCFESFPVRQHFVIFVRQITWLFSYPWKLAISNFR